MANYIGNQPLNGEFKKLDSIASQFNGSTVTFSLKFNTVVQSVGDASQLIVNLNGVQQEPLTSYTLTSGGGAITFSSAPASGDTCHIVMLGGVGGAVSTLADNTVTAEKIASSDTFTFGQVGVGTDPSSGFYVGANNLVVGTGAGEEGITIFGGQSTSYLLFADGTTGSATYAGQVRYVHTADQLQFATGNDSTARMAIASTGRVGIGTTNPQFRFHVEHGGTPVAKFQGSTNAYIDFTDGTVTSRIQNSGHSYFGSVTNNNTVLKAGGNEIMHILPGGFVGVGVTNPTKSFQVGTALGVYDDNAGNTVVAAEAGQNLELRARSGQLVSIYSGGSKAVTVDTNGRVGIGEQAPETPLHIKVAYGGDHVPMNNIGWNTWDGAQLLIQNTSTDSQNNYSSLGFYTGGSGGNFSSRIANVSEASGRGFMSFMLRSSDHTTHVNEKLRLTHDGRLGVNLKGTAPAHILDVEGDSDSQVAVAKITRIQPSASNNTYTFEVNSSAHTSNLSSGGAMAVDVNSGRAFTINGHGKVGISTDLTGPADDAKFHVHGFDYPTSKVLLTREDGSSYTATLQFEKHKTDANGLIQSTTGDRILQIYTRTSTGDSDGGTPFVSGPSLMIQTTEDATVANKVQGDLQFFGWNDARSSQQLKFTVSSDTGNVYTPGNIGIGTNAPANKLEIHSETATTNAAVDTLKIVQHSTGTTVDGFGSALYFVGERNNGVLQAQGRVGFTAETNSGSVIDSGFFVQTARSGVPVEAFRVHAGNSTASYLSAQSATQVRLVLGSTGNPLDNSSNWIRGNGTALQFNNAGGGYAWETTGAKKMILDASGDLLVGNTVVNPVSGFSNQKGFGYDASAGELEVAATSGNAALELGRNINTYGAIQVFRQEGTEYGRISTSNVAGGSVTIDGLSIIDGAGADTGLSFGGSNVYSRQNGSTANATVDLGHPNYPWRDAYFGGRVYASRINPDTGLYINALQGSAAAGVNVGSIYAGQTYANRSVSSNGGHVEAENGFYGTLIGEDTTAQPTLGDGGYGSVRMRVARGAYYSGSYSYIHIKTSLRHTANGTHGAVSEMYRVHIKGYSYGNSAGIDSVCVGYVYAGGLYLGSTNVHTRSGCRPVSQYMSSDGYLTFTIDANNYYTTFTLDWERHGGNGQLRDANSIISVTQSTSATI